MDRLLLDKLFEAIGSFIEEEGLGYAEAANRLGIPPWQMTRWFSISSKSYSGWTNPKPHILEKLSLAEVDSISPIALALLQREKAQPANFDFERASRAFGFNIGMPVALMSALAGNAKQSDLIRTAIFDLFGAFVNVRYFTELAARAIDGFHSNPIHPFGMVKVSDRDGAGWPGQTGRAILDWDFSDEHMAKQLSTTDDLLAAASKESNDLFNQLDLFLKPPTRSMASPADLALALIAADTANSIRAITHKMSGVFRDAVDTRPALTGSPIYRVAARVFEITEVTSRDTSVTDGVIAHIKDLWGDENVNRLLQRPQTEAAPIVKRKSGGFTASNQHSRTIVGDSGQPPSGMVLAEDAGYIPIGAHTVLPSPSEPAGPVEFDKWFGDWR
jgi:hypothetical protein